MILRINKKNNKTSKSNGNGKKLYLSVKEAAAYSGLSEHAMRKLIADKEMPYLTTGKKFLVNRVELKNYLKNRERFTS